MKDYQMCMVTALVLNKKYNFSRIIFHYMNDNISSGSKSLVYLRFVQMMLDHAYPNLVKDEQNDLLVLNHMDNETLIRLSKYTTNWPEPKTKTEFFGFIKSDEYEDPDLINHLKWRHDEEMKEKSAIDELTKLEEFVETRNEWFTHEVREKKRGGKRMPKVQPEEGSSSQPQKKRKKKAVETLLMDEPEEDETKADIEKDHEQVSPETEQLLKSIDDTLEVGKTASQNVEITIIRRPKETTSRKRVTTPAARKLIFRLKTKPPSEPQNKPPSPPPQQPPQSPQHHTLSPIHEQQITSPHLTFNKHHQFHNNHKFILLLNHPLDDFSFVNDDLVKKLQKKVDEVSSEKKKLEKRVKSVEVENVCLLKKVEADQADIDILKVRIAVLEEEKARRDEQNEYFKLKNKELEAQNSRKEHDEYMLKKVIEDLIEKSIEQRFEEIELEEVRAKLKAEIEVEMKNKGKNVQVEHVIEVSERAIVPSIVPESSIQEPCPITSVPGDEDDEEDEEDDNLKDHADEVYYVHDDDNDDDDQSTSGIKVTEASNEKNVDDYLQENENEEPENAKGEGEQGNVEKDDEIVDKSTRLILHLEHNVEEGEILHTYTLAEIIKMTHVDENEFNFDFEHELNKFDINQQPEYQYKYVEDADNYDRVEVEDCSDEDQSETLVLILLAIQLWQSYSVRQTKMNCEGELLKALRIHFFRNCQKKKSSKNVKSGSEKILKENSKGLYNTTEEIEMFLLEILLAVVICHMLMLMQSEESSMFSISSTFNI
ncbi:hypothetical protein Hanom_Chr14g01252551 [Helianthus anomalus]